MAIVGANDKYNKIMSQIGKWGSYYRQNPHRFIQEYFGIKLKMFQEIRNSRINYQLIINAVL